MKIEILFFIAFLITSMARAKANHPTNCMPVLQQHLEDSTRIAELDRYWAELSRTVREGDLEGMGAVYHSDAVIVFAIDENKASIPISLALERWKPGVLDTKQGKAVSNVEFRFSQRIGDETTAHETGIFHYTSIYDSGKTVVEYFTHFEMLLVKRNNRWYGLMEYQKSRATSEEWDALE